MSTNYYAFGSFPGGDTDEGLHIGQTAGGWRFLYRGWPEHDLTTARAWGQFLSQPDVTIRDEYGRPVTFNTFRRIAAGISSDDGRPLKSRWGVRATDQLRGHEHIDPDGHAFYNAEFC